MRLISPKKHLECIDVILMHHRENVIIREGEHTGFLKWFSSISNFLELHITAKDVTDISAGSGCLLILFSGPETEI